MMKKIVFTALIAVFAVLMLGAAAPEIAYAVPYDTYTQGPEGKMVPTQTAYKPHSAIKAKNSSLSAPEDMCIDGGCFYIADAGNKRVVKMSADGEILYSFSQFNGEDFGLPTGVSVSNEHVFVADKAKKLIYIFDKNTGAEISFIDKPDSPLIGDTPFVPSKIAADGRGNVYVACEGSVNGIMQLNFDGEFIGNVGANLTSPTLRSVLQNLLYSEKQKSTFFNTPRSPTNFTIADNGLLYTVTNGAHEAAIKKLNSQGKAIVSPKINVSNTLAVAVDSDANVYGVDSDGYITVYDSEGNTLFSFVGKSQQERLGVLSNPVAISQKDGDLYVLDKNYSFIVKYERTEFADLVFKAVSFYKDGLYLEGEQYWQEVIRYNSTFTLSYRALARANMKKGNYKQALQQFKLAEDREGYSDAYWEIRNIWLRSNFKYIIIAAAAAAVVLIAVKIVGRKNKKAFVKIKTLENKMHSVKFIAQLGYVKQFLKSPADAVYEVKYHNAAGPLSATVLYIWFVALQLLSVLITGYLFSNGTVYNTNAMEVVLYSTIPLLLAVVCNYFVSTVTDGEGKLWQCYTVTIYSMAPYLVLALPIFILSNFLTFNESVVLQAAKIFMYAWMGINMFRSIAELHDFTFGKTVKNLLLSACCFAMVILFAIVIAMLATQLFGYFYQLISEIVANAA